MKKYFYLLIVIVSCYIVSSCVKDDVPTTGNIVGVVKDYSTSETLQGCLVTLTPSGLSTSTGTDGRYEFSGISTESYTLEFSKEGYQAEKKSVSVIAGKNATVDVMLKKKEYKISLSDEILDFGDLENAKDLILSCETSTNVSIKSNADWITVNPTTGTVSKKGLKVSVIVNRSGFSAGEYSSSITLTSILGTQEIPVQMIIAFASAPTVEIVGNAYDIRETSLKIKGLITKTGGSIITNYGHCWSEGKEPTISNDKTNYGNRSSVGEYESSINNLIGGKTYFIKAYASNQNGTSYSKVFQITMPLLEKPTVITEAATDISENSATLNGHVSNNGGDDIIECGFYWGESQDAPNKLKLSSTENSFKSTLSSLKEGTTYYFKAYAVNSKGESIGDVLSFRTKTIGGQDEPSVITMDATNITYDKATLVGSITTNDVKIKEYGFLVGENQYQVNTYQVGSSPNNGTYTMELSKLDSGKKYVYAAYVITSKNKKIVGDYVSFQTKTKPKISRIKYSCYSNKETNKKTIYTYELYAEADLQGHTIKDAGFLFGYTYYSQDMTLHYTYDHIDIFQCTPSGNSFSLEIEKSESFSFTGGLYIKAFVVLDNDDEIYSEHKYLYDGVEYDITY